MRRLIVNADDFGLSSGVTRGIVEAFEHGILTSASLMVDRPAAEEAVSVAGELPLGLHADVDDVPPADVPAELVRQLARFLELTGRPPTHVDSHHHLHREAGHASFVQLADRHGLPLRDRDAPHCGLFYGRWDGESHPEQIGVESLLGILAGLADGDTELGCHPGYADGLRSSYTVEREQELRTLTDSRVRDRVAELGIELIDWTGIPLG
jgi:predicted glycoside hydrolase/deacetylase ChbG (UPF0249 family)